jgi:hypothetical protein
LATLPGLPGVPREKSIGALMDFHAITPAGVQHVLTTHREQTDESPLQLISAARLAYYQRIEAEYQRLRQALVLERDANEIASQRSVSHG